MFQGALEGQGLNSHLNGSRAGFSQSFRHSVKQSFGLKINSRLGNKANVLPAYRSTHISCEVMFTVEKFGIKQDCSLSYFPFLYVFTYLPLSYLRSTLICSGFFQCFQSICFVNQSYCNIFKILLTSIISINYITLQNTFLLSEKNP